MCIYIYIYIYIHTQGEGKGPTKIIEHYKKISLPLNYYLKFTCNT